MNHFFTPQRLGAIAASILACAILTLNASMPAQAQSGNYTLQSPSSASGQICGSAAAVLGPSSANTSSNNCGRGTVGVTPWDSSAWGPVFSQAQSFNTQASINDTTQLTNSINAVSTASSALNMVNTASSATYNTITVIQSAVVNANGAQSQANQAASVAAQSSNEAATAAYYTSVTNNLNANANNYATVANNTANSANYTASVANNTSNNNVAVANSANSIAGNAYAVGAAAVNAGNAAVNTANAAYGLAQVRKAGGNIAGIGSSTCGSFRVNYSNGTSSIVSISAGCFFGGH